jgi:hypothetical protein
MERKTKIRLHTHLKRMVNKASIMCWSVKEVHENIDRILKLYGVRDKLSLKENIYYVMKER